MERTCYLYLHIHYKPLYLSLIHICNFVYCVPLYDENQRRFESNKSTEKKVLKAIEQVANGEFEDWKVDAIKAELCRSFDLAMESNQQKAIILMRAFMDGKSPEEVLNYKDKIMAVTNQDVKRVAKMCIRDSRDYRLPLTILIL